MTMNKIVSEMLTNKVETLCLTGAFPEVNFKREEHFKSFNLSEWMVVRSKASKIVHDGLVEAGYEDGVWSTRLRSKAFVAKAEEIVGGLTEDRIKNATVRFRTWMD